MNLLKMVENGGRKRRSRSDISSFDENEGGIGCGWGVFHMNKYYQWPHFMRRITHHRRKRLMGSSGAATSVDKMQEQDKLIDGEQTADFSHGSNSSIKSWMKSLVSEELSKIKRRHHHSSSKRNRTSSASIDINLQEELTTDESNADYLKHEKLSESVTSYPEISDEFDELMNRKLVFTSRKSAESFTSNPKDYLDALDIISANKEFLVKALHDPGSPLARHFSNKQALNTKRTLYKCETFPLLGVSEKSGSNPSSPKKIQRVKSDVNGLTKSSTNPKRFKNIRQKIKHMIRESKKEMRRVAMDAIIHKIPHDQKIEIDCNQFENFETREDHVKMKSRLGRMTRASSLTESLDRYQQLYETSFKHGVSSERVQRLKIVPNNLARIYSLPDLRSYHSPKGESSKGYFGTRRSFGEQTSEDFPLRSNPMESIVEEEDPTELSSLKFDTENETKTVIDESTTENEAVLTSTESNEDNILSEESLINPALRIDEQSGHEPENPEEIPSKHLMSHISILQRVENKAEFSYVKDILEISGFSGDGFLGTWHTDDQPLDPLMYEETGGGSVFEPLLFDLVNEVLMEIYGRSYSYYPFPLSTLSHRSPMPIGQHVLKEVWALISWYLSLRSEVDQSVDLVVGSDVAKSGWWMNLQFDCECVGLELEDLIFQDLLEEIVWD